MTHSTEEHHITCISKSELTSQILVSVVLQKSNLL